VTTVFLLQTRAMVTSSSGGSPMMVRAPIGAVDHSKSPRILGLAWEVAHRCGGELGWRLGLGRDFTNSRIANALYIGENGLSHR
jgi:hypothetical protein